MDLKVSFRECTVYDGGYSVSYDGSPNFCPLFVADVGNVEGCDLAVKKAVEVLTAEVDAGLREPGTYYVSLQPSGRKVRRFDNWMKDIRYVDIVKKTIA